MVPTILCCALLLGGVITNVIAGDHVVFVHGLAGWGMGELVSFYNLIWRNCHRLLKELTISQLKSIREMSPIGDSME